MEQKDKKEDVRDRIKYNSLRTLVRDLPNFNRFEDTEYVRAKDRNYK